MSNTPPIAEIPTRPRRFTRVHLVSLALSAIGLGLLGVKHLHEVSAKAAFQRETRQLSRVAFAKMQAKEKQRMILIDAARSQSLNSYGAEREALVKRFKVDFENFERATKEADESVNLLLARLRKDDLSAKPVLDYGAFLHRMADNARHAATPDEREFAYLALEATMDLTFQDISPGQ